MNENIIDAPEVPEGKEQHIEIHDILHQVREHVEWTFNKTHAASREQTEMLLRGAKELQNNPEKIKDWDGFVEWSEKAILASKELATVLKKNLDEAVTKNWISKESGVRWMQRFQDEHVEYKKKEYWIKHQLPFYMDAWKKQAEEREKLLKDSDFILSQDAIKKSAILKDTNAFLRLHFDERKDFIAEIKANILAVKSRRTSLMHTASKKLQNAASRKIFSHAKIGTWLLRIFESKAKHRLIEDFVEGRGVNHLDTLIERWADVKERYDIAKSELATRSEGTNAWGLQIMGENEFLSMHYDQRERYVEELESRMRAARDIDKEHPLMLRLRYAMDVGDWDDAADLHAQALADPSINADDKERLRRMGRTIREHAVPTHTEEEAKMINTSKKGMDQALLMMQKTHPDCFPLALKLSKSLLPNRALKQWRQTVYNNLWTRSNGPPYLDDTIAREGASEEVQATTKYLAEHGKDTGMHDSIGATNAASNNLRTATMDGEARSKHRPTYIHCDVTNGEVVQSLDKFYEQEQHPGRLYWTTFCPHVKGLPYGEQKMRELFALATELRRHSRVLEQHGMLYQGIGRPLEKRGVVSLASKPMSQESTYSFAG